VVSGEPPAVLVVDESGGRYVLVGEVYRSDLARATYVDPAAGRRMFREYAEE
jgi:hypothetical protein